MAWPDFFPENCPPSDAVSPNFTVYRFIRAAPPVESDFNSYIEDGKEVSLLKKCQACGVSVYTELQDAIEMQGQVSGLRKKRIASAFLNSNHGKIRNTPSLVYPNCGHSHHTWWKPFDLLDPSEEFIVIDTN
jgi:hypothetical protein